MKPVKLKKCPRCKIVPNQISGSLQSPFEQSIQFMCPKCGRCVEYVSWAVSDKEIRRLEQAAVEGWNSGETGCFQEINAPARHFEKVER